MSERGTGVEIAGAEARLAVAERRRGQTRLLRVERRTPGAEGGRDGADRTHAARALAALPLAATTHRVLSLPFSDPRSLAQTVPLELAGRLPADPGDGCFGFELLARDAGGSQVLAFVARRRDLDHAEGDVRAIDATLAGITVGPLALRWLLPADFSGAVLVADGPRTAVAVWRDGRVRALRALAADGGDAAAVSAELAWSLPLLGAAAGDVLAIAGPHATPALGAALRERLVESTPLGSLLAPDLGLPSETIARWPVACGLALGALERAPRVPFPAAAPRRSPFTPRIARLAAAAAVLAMLDLGLVRLELSRRAAALGHAIGAEVARVLPGEPVLAPRTQLDAALAEVRARHGSLAYGTALARLREVSARVPDGLPVDLTRFTLDEEQLQLVGDAATFESVDVLRRALAGSARLRDVTADEVRTTVDGQRVGFRLRARWVAYGEAPS